MGKINIDPTVVIMIAGLLGATFGIGFSPTFAEKFFAFIIGLLFFTVGFILQLRRFKRFLEPEQSIESFE